MSAAASKLDIINLALDALGQDKISSAELTALTDDNVIVCNDNYDVVRLGLLRQYPFEFCTEQLALAQVDPQGLVISGCGIADANAGYNFVAVTTAEYDHETAAKDYYVKKVGGYWRVTNAAGTKAYFTAVDDVSWPWEVTAWTVGADGTAPAPKIYPGTPRDYAFLYKRPADCITPWAIWNPGSRKPDDRIRFKPFKNAYIAADMDEAVLVYAADNSTVSEFDALFVRAFALALAIAVYTKIKGFDKGRDVLKYELAGILASAKNVDASEQHEDQTALLGRRYTDL